MAPVKTALNVKASALGSVLQAFKKVELPAPTAEAALLRANKSAEARKSVTACELVASVFADTNVLMAAARLNNDLAKSSDERGVFSVLTALDNSDKYKP